MLSVLWNTDFSYVLSLASNEHSQLRDVIAVGLFQHQASNLGAFTEQTDKCMNQVLCCDIYLSSVITWGFFWAPWEPLSPGFLAGCLRPVTSGTWFCVSVIFIGNTSICDGKVYLLILCAERFPYFLEIGEVTRSLLEPILRAGWWPWGRTYCNFLLEKSKPHADQNRICPLCSIQDKIISWKGDVALPAGWKLDGKSCGYHCWTWRCLPFVSVWIVTKLS